MVNLLRKLDPDNIGDICFEELSKGMKE